MATLHDALSVPPGWNVVDSRLVVDITSVPPDTQVEVENVEFWGVTVFGVPINFGDVVGAMPDTATWLQQQASAHGSNVYGTALLHTTELNLFGIQVDRYRLVVVHSQFQFIAALLGAIVLVGLGIVWICDNRPAGNPCPDSVTSFPQQTLHEMCMIFGAGCAVQQISNTLILFSVASVAFAFAVYFFERGISHQDVKLPAVPRITPLAPPRISAQVGPPEIGPKLSVSSGGRGGGGRRGAGRG